jgi:thiol-disulfide isomerase/thioredoxin
MRLRRQHAGLAAVGLGLIILGGALWLLVSRSGAGAVSGATDFSAIPVAVNLDPPSLALADLGGTRHALADYRGKVVLVNLWATWCPPCTAEMPMLQEFYERHARDGFIVIAIEDGDPMGQVVAFVKDHRLTFPIWLDPAYTAADRIFKTSNLPSSYLLDRAGTIRLRWIGAISESNLENYVTPLIKE